MACACEWAMSKEMYVLGYGQGGLERVGLVV